MQQFYSILKENTLFRNFDAQSLDGILSCLNAHIKHFSKNEVIRPPETLVTETGIVVKGLVYLTKTDINGKRVIMSELETGKSFGESLAFTGAQNSPICVISATESTVVFMSAKRILDACASPCGFHKQLLENTIKLLAEKNMNLQIKNDILAQKTTREKLLLYLEYASKSAGSKSFRIHFSREELADFLSINQSAMSRELGKMRDENLLTFYKNSFKLSDDI